MPTATRWPFGQPRGPTVMVVDDDSELRYTIADVVRSSAGIRGAANGARRGRVARVRLNLILLELLLPSADAWIFTSEAEVRVSLGGIPEVVTSAVLTFAARRK